MVRGRQQLFKRDSPPGRAWPPGADTVLDTDVYTEIADLTDAPVPVRATW